jgi:hypothetical protein
MHSFASFVRFGVKSGPSGGHRLKSAMGQKEKGTRQVSPQSCRTPSWNWLTLLSKILRMRALQLLHESSSGRDLFDEWPDKNVDLRLFTVIFIAMCSNIRLPMGAAQETFNAEQQLFIRRCPLCDFMCCLKEWDSRPI